MFLQKTNFAIQESEEHLEKSGNKGSAIESFLTQHILILLCAEMQQEIYKIVEQRLSSNSDQRIIRFGLVASQKLLRSVKKEEIAGYLCYFGDDLKDGFKNAFTDQEVAIYNNAVNSRIDVAHRHGAVISFDDIKQAFMVAEKILLEVEKSLG